MERYKIVKKRAFESTGKFEKRLNDLYLSGWSVVSLVAGHSGYGLVALVQKRS